MKKIALHWVALLMETGGTLFSWLELTRINKMVSILGLSSFDGEPKEYQKWYYHCGSFGFTLLFAGILVAGFALLLEHMEFRKRQLKPPLPRDVE